MTPDLMGDKPITSAIPKLIFGVNYRKLATPESKKKKKEFVIMRRVNTSEVVSRERSLRVLIARLSEDWCFFFTTLLIGFNDPRCCNILIS